MTSHWTCEGCHIQGVNEGCRYVRASTAQAVARRKLRQIESFMPSGANVLLDYGCGSGTWLALLRDMGCAFRMIGTDVVSSPLQKLRDREMEAYQCDETTLLEYVQPGSVGLVHMFHVIEHLPDVTRVLKAIREKEPREISLLVAYLASPAADFITGQVISPNGGEVIVGF